MLKVGSSDVLMEAIGRVRRTSGTFMTSFFASPQQVEGWADRGLVEYSADDQCVLVIRRSNQFDRLYHIASNGGALSSALSALDVRTTLIADLIASTEDCATVRCYEEKGFVERAVLVRMSRMPENATLHSDCAEKVDFAEGKDVTAVSGFFARLLDPLVDQIPDEEDLRAAAEKGQLLVARREDKLGGVLMFEATGATSHLRYWYVDPTTRNLGIGAQLMSRFLNRCRGSRRIVLWVEARNADAIAKYEHYGFRRENLVDRIMVKRCESDVSLSDISESLRSPKPPISGPSPKDELHV